VLRELRVAPGRVLKATPVFDTYWRFAARRQEVFVRRAMGTPPPWTDDRVIAAHRFTNAYRAADRVSQYLIRNVIYEGDQSGQEVFFRTLLFKLFNRIETWEMLKSTLGTPVWGSFDHERYGAALDAVMSRGDRVYSAAYIMPSPSFGNARKHRNHLVLLEQMMRSGTPALIESARSLESVFGILRLQPSFGDFLAFQFAIDLNYSEMLHFSEMDFVVAGPGARDGIRKCFADVADLDEADVIRVVADLAESEFARLGLRFETLWGRPLQLIDVQNLFCEVSKYARVAHPEIAGITGRTRIKQKYVPRREPLLQWYPPKWKLTVPAAASTAELEDRSRVRQAALPFALALAG
jgi:hypothetical protein